jgi:hypothetical protein
VWCLGRDLKIPDTSEHDYEARQVIDLFFKRRAEQVQTVEDLAEYLELFLNSGCSVWTEPNGEQFLTETRALVDRINGLAIHIYSNEHAPPHFHVKSADIDAVFNLTDLSFIKGSVNRKTRELIEYWYLNLNGRQKAIEVWNNTRPTDCPVGPIRDNNKQPAEVKLTGEPRQA